MSLLITPSTEDPRQHHDGKRPRISDSRRLFVYRCNLAIQPSREEVDDLSHQIAWPPRGDTGPRSAPLLAAFAAPTSPAARKILTTTCAFRAEGSFNRSYFGG